MIKIKINNEVSFHAEKSACILEAAKSNNITLEHSCLNGRCNSCKAKLELGETEVIRPEIGLTEWEINEGFILTCSRRALSDVEISVDNYIEGLLETPRTIPAKVNTVIQHTPNLIELELKLPPNANFIFQPGQYVNIIRGPIRRSYSIASMTSDGRISFFIRSYEGGEMSHYFFSEMKINDLLRIEGPFGTFFYRKTNLKNIIFLATGTGIAPVNSILQEIETNPELVEGKSIYVFWGNRKITDAFWSPKIKNVKVEYFPCFSQEDIKQSGIYYGYVQNVLAEKDIDFKNSEIYACGSPQMINEAFELFVQKGGCSKWFKSDTFVSSKQEL
jgi:CDP-4-dehydro-6-deoxyglucose reductase